MVPVVNLEWIQKIHRDGAERGYSAEATVDTIMRRMPDYIKYITPQFSHTHINFQRVATVDTSNPFIARDIPTPDESFVVVRFRDPKGVDFPYMLSDDPELLHVARQHAGRAGRQDEPCDGNHPRADHARDDPEQEEVNILKGTAGEADGKFASPFYLQ